MQPDTRTTHSWALQTQQGDEDWKNVGYSCGFPMALTDPEPQRWQQMERFANRQWRVLLTVTTTTIRKEIVR